MRVLAQVVCVQLVLMLWLSLLLVFCIILLSCIWLYMGAKTAALANARQVQKLCRHNQSTEFELQRPWDFWSNVCLCPRLRVWHLHAAEWTFLLIHHGMLIYTLQSHGVAQAAYTCGCLNRARVMQCTVTACTLLWLLATRNTAHSFGGKMLRKLGRGSPRFTPEGHLWCECRSAR